MSCPAVFALADAVRCMRWTDTLADRQDARPLLLNASSVSLPHIQMEDILRKRKKMPAHHHPHAVDTIGEEQTTESGEIIANDDGTAAGKSEDSHDLKHRDEYQVELDVNRSFVQYPMGGCER